MQAWHITTQNQRLFIFVVTRKIKRSLISTVDIGHLFKRSNASYLLKLLDSSRVIFPLIRPLCFHQLFTWLQKQDAEISFVSFLAERQKDTWTALITWFTPPQFDHELINILVFFLNLPWLVVGHFNSLPRYSRINDLGRSDYSQVNDAAIQGHFAASLEKKLALNIALLWSPSDRYYSKHKTEIGLQELLILYKTPANTRCYHIIRRGNFLRVRTQTMFYASGISISPPER